MISKIKRLIKKYKEHDTCRVCGKKLYSKDSRAIGIGPTCRLGNKHIREMKFLEKQGQLTFNINGGANERDCKEQ